MDVAEKQARKQEKKIERNKTVLVVVVPPACPNCGSISVGDYHNKRTTEVSGVAPNGAIYNAIIRRGCRCLKCGQALTEMTYEDQ